jgi:PIN domain nuclease of toxin-antitoxin system
MRYLLDTHTVLWLACNSPKLSLNAKRFILEEPGEKCVSIISAWELAIKYSIQKLQIDGGLSEFFSIADCNGFQILPIERKHIDGIINLPFYHRDPFDRLLIATAKTEKMTLITADKNIHRYEIQWVW